ncbi:hypothetical protein [Bifidobacterium biavatii]|uniref:hypothetical protein n=1 Tax=Bifidobacterium biavatii TaxID=762212 RepID=UPI000691D82E|nr:hypothetical protein [Bifidobacterium biavatii]
MYYNNGIGVKRSAFKHGVPLEDSMYVVEHYMRREVMQEDPPKDLLLGFTQHGVALEVILLFDDDRWWLIHAMPIRKKYNETLERSGRWFTTTTVYRFMRILIFRLKWPLGFRRQ